jgi:hypothetical protein
MEELYNGASKRIALRKKILCPDCEGYAPEPEVPWRFSSHAGVLFPQTRGQSWRLPAMHCMRWQRCAGEL